MSNAMVTLAAMLSAGLGFTAGRATRPGPKPKGPQVQNADIAKEAKVSCKRCRGKGAYDGGKSTWQLCVCALTAFNRRHGHEVEEWRGDTYWKEPPRP